MVIGTLELISLLANREGDATENEMSKAIESATDSQLKLALRFMTDKRLKRKIIEELTERGYRRIKKYKEQEEMRLHGKNTLPSGQKL